MEGWQSTRAFSWGSGTIQSSVGVCMFMGGGRGGKRVSATARERENDFKISSNSVHECQVEFCHQSQEMKSVLQTGGREKGQSLISLKVESEVRSWWWVQLEAGIVQDSVSRAQRVWVGGAGKPVQWSLPELMA